MKNRERILDEFRKVPENTLIMTGKLYQEKFRGQMGEAAFTQAISRLSRSGEIERISKGIYCRPKKTRFGSILPSDREIVGLFTDQTSGLIVGYNLYNSLGVTTQISKSVIAYSSRVDERLKQIGNVTIHKYDLLYSETTKAIIRLVELLHNYRDIQNIDYSAFLQVTKSLAVQYNDETFETIQEVIGYPKRTIAFLREMLDYYHIPNDLSKYLSSFSDYRIPKMEELYETAFESK